MLDSLTFPFDEALPPPGTISEVAPGVRWARMPLPFTLNHVNLWLIEDGDGWAAIDTGFATEEVVGLWERIIENELPGGLTRLVCTHFHPDHMGLSGWLAERFGVELWASFSCWAMGRLMSTGGISSPAVVDGFYTRAGCGPEQLDAISRQRGRNPFNKFGPIPASYRRLVDGDRLEIGGRAWRVITAEGHAPEHVCLYSAELNLLISGDQVLPRITPNINIHYNEPDADTLSDFLESFAKFADIPGDVLVLPSHGLPFKGLHHRLEDFRIHHDQRLAEALAACAEPRTGLEAMRILFPNKLNDMDTYFALGETLAHLHYLLRKGRLQRRLDAGGVYLFERAG